jgi:ABC-2 type transport system ATP-binding protein
VGDRTVTLPARGQGLRGPPDLGAAGARYVGRVADLPAVDARALVKVFAKGSVRALDGLSLEVPQGTILGLLGPNGAGKTTMVRVLSTTLVPDSGTASVLGQDVVRHPNRVRRLIGLAGQYATVDGNLTGRENLRMVSRLSHMGRSESWKRADELLESFDLTHAANRPLKHYSGGMRRRIDLAAALVARPPVVFLDEPTTGLDPQSRLGLWGVIEGLVNEGTTVLLSTQYLEEADRLSERIVVIDHGKVLAQGTSAELKAGLGTSVLSLTFDGPEVTRRASTLLASLSTKEPFVLADTVEITVTSGPKAAAEALRLLDQHDLEVAGIQLREPSLDDVFLTLTGHRTEETEAQDAPELDGAGARG